MYVNRNATPPVVHCRDCNSVMHVDFVGRLMNPDEGYFQVTCSTDDCPLFDFSLPVDQYMELTEENLVGYRRVVRPSTEDVIRLTNDHRNRLDSATRR